MTPPAPQLDTLVEAAPEGDGWLHDGYRILAVRERGAVRLYTRRGNDWTASFPTIAEAIAKLPGGRLVIDGEAAVIGADGITSFQALQHALGTRADNLVFFAFDLLAQDRADLAKRPLLERKAALAKLLRKPPHAIRYSDHVVGRGAEMFAAACERGLEGIISKRADAPYTPGRGASWVKTKCKKRQELVVGGFTDPSGSRTGLGALLVGHFERGELRYAGKVGTGFSAQTLRELHAALAAIERKTSPFEPTPPRAATGPGAHWVAPTIVIEVEFAEWTADGRLRHPSFQGIRKDKRATDVIREVPRTT
jgi:bifunctional non-homologous end joining protein LigD